MDSAIHQQLHEEQDQLKQHQKPQPPPTAEDEALKRNTDCVYFLASPLTCKKGSECEYRHSEYARVNPRDCYYWLNGNCLNPKCGFRHPPLDGLLGTQAATPAGASASSVHTAVPVAAHVPYSSTAPYNPVAPSSSSKPAAVPCIFYQKGYCMKGDRCAFLHGPVVPTGNKAQQATAASPATGPPSSKKMSGAPPSQQHNVLPPNVTKTFGVVLHNPKPAPKVEAIPPRNGNRYAPQTGLSEEVPRYKPSIVPPVVNGSSMAHTNISHQAYGSVKDNDEHLRESSPGFDVLVDDEIGDEEYYHGENQYGGGQEGRNGNEYDIGRSANYDAPSDMDREMFRDKRGYDSYERMQGQYDWDQRRNSSERISLGSGHTERRGYSKGESPDRIGESDLRYRLSKQRRANNGPRSVVAHDRSPENHVDERRSYRSSSQRGSHQHQHESSLSSRLRGRIKLPETESRSERAVEGGRSWGRLSPGRPQISHSGRLRDRIKGREEDRSIRDRPRARDDSLPNFSGPKRLAELKDGNTLDNKDHVLRKRKALEDNHQSAGDLSFAGPMPLSEILKRKRQAKTEATENGSLSPNQENKDQNVIKNSVLSPESKPAIAEAVEVEGKTVESSQPPIASDHEVEDGMIMDEGVEEHELEGEELQGEDGEGEEYYYEQGEEGDYNYEDAENLGPEEEYLDDEDGDDFAKKIGVMSS